MPKVSVIIPNYNHARFLPKRIESVLRQTYQDFELILLDDCSKDESRTILLHYAGDPRVRLAFNDTNSGSAFRQWNRGVRLAQGEYVWIAESDDYADERLLQTLVGRLEHNPSAALAYCRSWRVSAAGEVDGFWDASLSDLDAVRWTENFSAIGRDECAKYLFVRNTVQNASSVVFRRDAYWKAGGASEDLFYCGDWKLWASMALAGGMIEHSGEPLNYYRFHDSSVTKHDGPVGVAIGEWLRVVIWILERVTPGKSQMGRLRREFAYHWVPVVLDRCIRVAIRKRILLDACKIDPYALMRLARALAVALRLTTLRRVRDLRARRLANARTSS